MANPVGRPPAIENVKRMLEENSGILVLEDGPELSFMQKVISPLVYVLKCGPYYKIGYTSVNIASRLSQLQAGNPYEITFVMAFKTERYKEMEALLHSFSKHKHARGEWFELDESDVRVLTGAVKSHVKDLCL